MELRVYLLIKTFLLKELVLLVYQHVFPFSSIPFPTYICFWPKSPQRPCSFNPITHSQFLTYAANQSIFSTISLPFLHMWFLLQVKNGMYNYGTDFVSASGIYFFWMTFLFSLTMEGLQPLKFLFFASYSRFLEESGLIQLW